MFSGNMKLLLTVLSILLGLYIISKLKFFILILSWGIIFVCLCILYAKAHPENRKLNQVVSDWLTRFLRSKFFSTLIKLKNKFFEKRK